MKRPLLRQAKRVLLALTVLPLAGCYYFGGTGSLVDVVWPGMTEEFYRMEGTVCTAPEEVEDAAGIVIAVRFTFAKLGNPCEEEARDVLVSIGRDEAVKRARGLRINQRVSVTGVLEGPHEETLMARKVVVNRR